MIGYVTLGPNGLPRAFAFYDALLVGIGATRTWNSETCFASGAERGRAVAVSKPHNDQPATVGIGVTVALAMKSADEVDRFHAKAVALGATDQGPAGARGGGFHAGYFRDLDGNKSCACFVG